MASGSDSEDGGGCVCRPCRRVRHDRRARGDITGAIRLLEKGRLERKHPREHHLRQWYALADLYERAGNIPRARDLFTRVAHLDPDAFDVRDRLRALR